MRWACPHCQVSLQTDAGSGGPDLVGPRPGWAYARCSECREFALIEIESGRAQAIERTKKTTKAPAPVVPPPFKHARSATEPAIAPAAAAAVTAPAAATAHVAESATQSEPAIHAQPRAPLPEALPPIEPKPPTQGGYAGLLTFAGIVMLGTGAVLHWTVGQATAPIRAFARAAAQPAEERAQPKPESKHERAATRPEPKPEQRIAASDDPPIVEAGPTSALDDSLRSHAMAPRRIKAEDIQLYLQARRSVHSMELRTGPGVEFPLMGLADLEERYPVLEIHNRWFRVQLEETPGLSAWVPYERVELFSHDKGPDYERSVE